MAYKQNWSIRNTISNLEEKVEDLDSQWKLWINKNFGDHEQTASMNRRHRRKRAPAGWHRPDLQHGHKRQLPRCIENYQRKFTNHKQGQTH